MVPKHKRPEVVGFFIPADRSSDYDGREVNPLTGEVTYPPSMTKQEFVAECDINNIIREYTMTGQVTHISAKAAQGAFLDLPDSVDYQESLNLVIAAGKAFSDLPSGIRNRFENDPAQFLAFMDDPANQEEMISLGLAVDTRPPMPSNLGDGGAGQAPEEPPRTNGAPPKSPDR